jgi:hypothetical protein
MSVQHDNEEHILSSLYGMTVAGLRAMQTKQSNTHIQHLIARAIEFKESSSEEAATLATKPKGARRKKNATL